jgi:hypothetical protein
VTAHLHRVCMYIVYVHRVCTSCMYIVYVHRVCTSCMYIVYVCTYMYHCKCARHINAFKNRVTRIEAKFWRISTSPIMENCSRLKLCYSLLRFGGRGGSSLTLNEELSQLILTIEPTLLTILIIVGDLHSG